MTKHAVTVRDGQIFWRGIYKSPEEAERLAAHFDGVSDWFKPDARRFARELRAALNQVQPREIAA